MSDLTPEAYYPTADENRDFILGVYDSMLTGTLPGTAGAMAVHPYCQYLESLPDAVRPESPANAEALGLLITPDIPSQP